MIAGTACGAEKRRGRLSLATAGAARASQAPREAAGAAGGGACDARRCEVDCGAPRSLGVSSPARDLRHAAKPTLRSPPPTTIGAAGPAACPVVDAPSCVILKVPLRSFSFCMRRIAMRAPAPRWKQQQSRRTARPHARIVRDEMK